ncbi:hypothetical protein SEA_KARDASHIAN_13 [Streptomyces phage Kardashian]|nr:hypothetical protein SEA_KARDASHIAN_13 [Streptomyces phage Kardashian]
MTRFSGKVGYGVTVETSPGVHEDQIHERSHFGDVERNSLKFREGESVNNDLSVSNSISILADAYAIEHIASIRYVEWLGALWTISEVELRSPRILLRLGGVYNGPRPEAP